MSSHDFINACEYLRATVVGGDQTSPSLNQSQAEQIINVVAQAMGMRDEELAHKLANYWAAFPAI
ncbi:hypothetical protein [Paraburkholderia susongensis]|uniref:Uncharacterized protein n=1 Tax=Paraburkholderia susongensis TaxID=1515439 RepID=A0A1X7M7N3_9BURK|nr:hypothetical protein [Paraburkholderia susongensis]SMG61543.1 hypothetical protein SAMN06265784_12313 [Paraburkholderia susongensis]